MMAPYKAGSVCQLDKYFARSTQDNSCARIRKNLVFETEKFLCSNQRISCVRIKRYRAVQSRRLLCSNQTISCVPIMTSLVFQSRHVLCSNQEMSCVPIKKFSRSKTTPFFQDSTRHFWPNFGERPRILPVRNPKQKNPGTIAKIRPKVACDIFEILVSENFIRIFFRIFFSIFFQFFFAPKLNLGSMFFYRVFNNFSIFSNITKN